MKTGKKVRGSNPSNNFKLKKKFIHLESEPTIKAEMDEILARADAILKNPTAKDEYSEILIEIWSAFLTLVTLNANWRLQKDLCGQCVKNYSVDEHSTCITSQAVVEVILHILYGIILNIKSRKNFVYPDILIRLEQFCAQNSGKINCEALTEE